jgi:spore germination protein YaaH
MNKKTVLISGIIGTVVIAGVTSTFFFFNSRKSMPISIETISNILTHSPTVVPTKDTTQSILEELGKIVVIPSNYKLNQGNISSAQKSQIDTIFTLQPISQENIDFIEKYKNDFNFQIVSDGSTYKKCLESAEADNTKTANQSKLSPYYISKGDCTAGIKVINIKELTCDINETECQVIFTENLHGSSLLFLSNAPFVYSFAMPQIRTEIKNGVVITTWENQAPLGIAQTSYSIEYLDQKGIRLFASGRLTASNQGDYFLPPIQLSRQLMSLKLRVWYSINTVAISNPVAYDYAFDYYYEPTQPTANSKTPVQMSWIPDWGMEAGITSVKKSPTKWQTVSPVWFTPNGNGTLNVEPTTNSGKLIPLLRTNKTKIVPTISLFDADILKDILRNHQQTHIDNIVKLVNGNNYDGIDLDYESTYEDDKELLTQFVTALAVKLHASNKILSFTALPKIDDRRIYAFLPQTHVAQDWKAIGAVVDEFRIMAYDFTGQGSKLPGPLSPIVWNELLIQYATANIPAEKVVLALPLYAHGWPKPTTDNIAGPLNDQTLSAGILKNTISPQHENIAYMKGHSTYYRESYDSWYQEMRVDMKYNGIERVMYYLDKNSINARLELAKKYGIKGVCYWRIGGEIL